MANADPNPRLTPELETSLRRYVLGGLDEAGRSKLEEQIVTDTDVFEALGVVEDELIEEYLDGASTDQDRAAFEQHFLTSPQRQARLRLAKSLRRHASQGMAAGPARLPVSGAGSVARSQPAWLALAAALVLSLAGNVWLASRRGAPQVSTGSAQAITVASPPQTPTELSAELQRERDERSKAEARIASLEEAARRSRSSVSFVLAAGALRGAGSVQRIAVPSDAMLVRLRLELPGNDYPTYRAALLNDAGEELWAASKLKAEVESGKAFVVLPLTPDRLPRGDFQVKLTGLTSAGDAEAIGSYSFRVSQP